MIEGRARLREVGILYRSALYPLADDGIAIDHLLGAANYRPLRENEHLRTAPRSDEMALSWASWGSMRSVPLTTASSIAAAFIISGVWRSHSLSLEIGAARWPPGAQKSVQEPGRQSANPYRHAVCPSGASHPHRLPDQGLGEPNDRRRRTLAKSPDQHLPFP